MNQPKLVVLALVALTSSNALAWGPLGHRMVTETAALLIQDGKDPGWGRFLSRHRVTLGVYALLPDTSFKKTHFNEEDPTHFLDLDHLVGAHADASSPEFQQSLAQIPLDQAKARAFFRKLPGIKDPNRVGELPWRIFQFVARARKDLQGLSGISGGYRMSPKTPGEAKLHAGLLDLGLLSHYTGDALMPYHATSDFNGWKTGEGGIHFFFEAECVDALEPGLSGPVLDLAKKEGDRWISEWRKKATELHGSPELGLILEALADSYQAIHEVSKIDLEKIVVKPSVTSPRTAAVRKPDAEACPEFKNLLIERLAKSAVLTTEIWRQAFPKDFVPPATLAFGDMELNLPYPEPK